MTASQVTGKSIESHKNHMSDQSLKPDTMMRRENEPGFNRPFETKHPLDISAAGPQRKSKFSSRDLKRR